MRDPMPKPKHNYYSDEQLDVSSRSYAMVILVASNAIMFGVGGTIGALLAVHNYVC
jgi:hypothetical protein